MCRWTRLTTCRCGLVALAAISRRDRCGEAWRRDPRSLEAAGTCPAAIESWYAEFRVSRPRWTRRPRATAAATLPPLAQRTAPGKQTRPRRAPGATTNAPAVVTIENLQQFLASRCSLNVGYSQYRGAVATGSMIRLRY